VPVAARLAVAMLGLQVSIGALNDLVDAPADAGRKPGKPIPRGAATIGEARLIAIGGFLVACALTLPSGAAAVAVLALCALCGYGYDIRLSRTAVSWLPLAIALPLVPVYAWLGATGGIPAALLPLVPAGVLAGAGLSIANGLADLERDVAAGSASIVVRLGRPMAFGAHALLLAGAVVVALVAGPAPRPALFAGIGVIVVGVLIGWWSGGPARRERAWEFEAIGVALLGAGWIGALVGVG
jgi:4-hydroxybenzoate polyprenyltransferase